MYVKQLFISCVVVIFQNRALGILQICNFKMLLFNLPEWLDRNSYFTNTTDDWVLHELVLFTPQHQSEGYCTSNVG